MNDNQKLVDRYLLLCQAKGLTEETVRSFGIDLKVFLDFIGDKPLSEVDHFTCEDFIMYCQTERDNGDKAIARKFTTLNGFFKTAIKKEYLDIKNPLDKLDKPKVRKTQREHLTKEEIDKIFNYLESTGKIRDLAIFSLLFSSGIRLSELHRLNIRDVDFENKRLNVMGKGMKPRISIFDDYAKANILKYLESREDNFEFLFVSRENKRLSKKSIQNLIKLRVREAGIDKNMSTHNIRHSCAMYHLKQGVPLNIIQKILGHENIGTTQIYAHNTMDDVEEYLKNN